nr:facilitated trehalose transporter Tret1-like [Halyomorpha halys]
MILLPSITKRNLTNNHDSFSVNNEDTAWYLSSIYLSLITGYILFNLGCRTVGRKRILFLVNTPMIIAWVILGISWSKETLLLANSILGISIGYLEGTVSDYINQISQPRLRKALASFSDVFRAFGALLVSGLGLFTTWRIAAFAGVFLHIFVVFVISSIPETAKLLNSGSELGMVKKALCWLIQWPLPPQDANGSQVSVVAQKNYTTGGNISFKSPTLLIKQLNLLKTSKIFKPLLLSGMLLFISNFDGTVASQPYVYMLTKEYSMPVPESYSAFVFSIVAFAGSVLSKVTHRWFDRKLSVLCSVGVATISTVMLCFSSSWVAFFSYFMLVFANSYGLEGNMWSLFHDVFPQEGRALTFRLVTAVDILYNAIAVSTYFDLKSCLGIQYLFLFFTFVNCLGFIAIYRFMPKTDKINAEETETNQNQIQVNIIRIDP